jgi:NAD(P) transhydrogenase
MQHVIQREKEVIRHQLHRNHVECLKGIASFADPHTLAISYVFLFIKSSA